MEITKVTRICCILVILAAIALLDYAIAAEVPATLDPGMGLNEMPVLDGKSWQSMSPDTKIAFIWGIGHVVTVEEHVLQRYPEMKRQDFVAKLADGLRGVPMSSIIERIDGYYRKNPEDLDLPVLRVMWSEIVRPRLQTGIADLPFPAEE